MKKLGNFTDDCVGLDYTLYYAKLSEVRDIVNRSLVNSGISDVSVFDIEHKTWVSHEKPDMTLARELAYINNGYICLQSDEDLTDVWLLDGYTRLFKLSSDASTFVRVYSRDVPASKVMTMLIQLNYWKTSTRDARRFLDRGFALYTFLRCGINLSDRRERCPFNDVFNLIAKSYVERLGNNRWGDYIGEITHDRFFDDLVLLKRLHDIKLSLIRRNEQSELYVPVAFYRLIGTIRKAWIAKGEQDRELKIDVADVVEWMKTDKTFMKRAQEYYEKYNSNGQASAINDLTERFQNKYLLPVVLGIKGEYTDVEKKAMYKKSVDTFKKNYKSVSLIELAALPADTEVFTIKSSYPGPLQLCAFKFKGTSSEVHTWIPVGLQKEPRSETKMYYNFIETHNSKVNLENGDVDTKEIGKELKLDSSSVRDYFKFYVRCR